MQCMPRKCGGGGGGAWGGGGGGGGGASMSVKERLGGVQRYEALQGGGGVSSFPEKSVT